jgi:membrane protease YdiL (CAAX protease family)
LENSKFNELLFYIIFFSIFLIVANTIVSQTFHQKETASGMMPVSSMLIPAVIQIALIFLIIFAAKLGGNSLKDIGFKTYSWWKDCLVGLGAFTVWFFVIPWLDKFFIGFVHLSKVGVSEVSFSIFWVLSATAFGLAEEIIFRGYGYTVLNKYVNSPWISILIVSVMFGAVHLYQGTAVAVELFIIAIMLNYIFIWRGSLIPIIMGHVAMDIIAPFLG